MTYWLRVTCVNRAVVMLIQNIFHVCPLEKCICRQHGQSWSGGCLLTWCVTHACTSCKSLVQAQKYTNRSKHCMSLQGAGWPPRTVVVWRWQCQLCAGSLSLLCLQIHASTQSLFSLRALHIPPGSSERPKKDGSCMQSYAKSQVSVLNRYEARDLSSAVTELSACLPQQK